MYRVCCFGKRFVDYIRICIWRLFFFQAEDGIRDLVRSRGLGDVYKRQVFRMSEKVHFYRTKGCIEFCVLVGFMFGSRGILTVSYTHLTLPTSDLV